jgi:hypothetical protein
MSDAQAQRLLEVNLDVPVPFSGGLLLGHSFTSSTYVT